MNTTAREIVRDYSARIEGVGIFFAPHIPTRRLKNAIRSFAPGVSESDALVLVDGSFLGSGKAGGLLTEDTLHVCNLGEEPQRIALADVDRVAIAENGKSLRVNDMDFLVIDLPNEGSRHLFAQMVRDVSLLQEGKRVVRTSVRDIVQHHSTIVRAVHVFFAPHIPTRKLKNAIRSVAPGVSEGDVLEPAGLPERIVKGTPQIGSESAASGLSSLAQTVAQATEKAEKEAIQEMLLKTGGNREKAAELLGIGRATLYRKLKQYGIE